MKPARKNRIPFLFATLLIWSAISPRFLSANEDWYMKIPPGATREDIREMAGEPLSTKSARAFLKGQAIYLPDLLAEFTVSSNLFLCDRGE